MIRIGKAQIVLPLFYNVGCLQSDIQLVLNPGHQNLHILLYTGKGRFHLLIEQIQGQNHLAPGQVQVEADLVLRGQRVHHVGHRADAVDGIKAVQGLGGVGHADGNRIPGPDAHGEKCTCRTFNAPNKGIVAGFRSVEFIGGLCGILPGNRLHHLKHGLLRIFQVLPLNKGFS